MPKPKPGQSEIWVPEPHPIGDGFLPQWVTEQLRADHSPISRQARVRYCRKCGAIVLRGLDGEWCAAEAVADPTPITARLEYACYLTDRPTYNAIGGGESWQLGDRMLRWVRPPESERWAVVPAHRCGGRFPGFLVPPVQPQEYNQAPPF